MSTDVTKLLTSSTGPVGSAILRGAKLLSAEHRVRNIIAVQTALAGSYESWYSISESDTEMGPSTKIAETLWRLTQVSSSAKRLNVLNMLGNVTRKLQDCALWYNCAWAATV